MMAIRCGGVFVNQEAGATIKARCNARPIGRSAYRTAMNTNPTKQIANKRICAPVD